MKEKHCIRTCHFFSDAVVAIAITAYWSWGWTAGTSRDSALIKPRHNYAAFLLSFVTIAGLWRTHHNFFVHIERIDERSLYQFCVVFWSFTIFNYTGKPIFWWYLLYLHVQSQYFLLSLSQNCMELRQRKRIHDIWRNAVGRPNASLDDERLCHQCFFLAMVFSFYMPKTAFLLLF